VRWAAGDTAGALVALDSAGRVPALRDHQTAALLEDAVSAGDTAAVARLAGRLRGTALEDRTLSAPPRARAAAGDTAGAAAAWEAVLSRLDGAAAGQAWLGVADAARIRGDSAGALRAYREALVAAPRSRAAERAAGWVVQAGGLSAGLALAAARALDRAGDGGGALRAYDAYVDLTRAAGGEPDAGARVERARLMTTLPSRQEAGIEEWRELARHPDPGVGVRTLRLWRDLRLRQGETRKAATLRRWLVDRYPDTDAAAQVVFLRGDAAHDRQAWDAALDHYARVATMAPTRNAAGLARMRTAQIHLQRGDEGAALAAFQGYLNDFPRGRRWEEASFWSARILVDRGDHAAARPYLDRLRAEAPLSYYTVLAAELEGQPYALPLPAGPSDPPPAWLGQALRRVDLLEMAGLDEPVDEELAALERRAREAGVAAMLALAEALNARGRTLDGINLGWAARERGAPWSLRLARVLYPFPYRDMVEREAAAKSLDPLLMAALIRQESAFVADIRSGAGAVGLMQVMPATGRDVARRIGPEAFTPESLETPEVNLHLGATFLSDMLDRFGPELPLVLSAYNAGPSRAARWRRLPEAADRLRFTERIPFTETRGYVKNVTRNRVLYEILWGGEAGVS
jgi:soluble lytic murein transglycosylase